MKLEDLRKGMLVWINKMDLIAVITSIDGEDMTLFKIGRITGKELEDKTVLWSFDDDKWTSQFTHQMEVKTAYAVHLTEYQFISYPDCEIIQHT